MNTGETISGACQPERVIDDIAKKKQEVNIALMQQALDQDDPMRASLGIAIAELFDMSSQVKGSIRECFNANPNSTEVPKLAGPAFEQYFKCLRQADRFAHLDVQLRKPAK